MKRYIPNFSQGGQKYAYDQPTYQEGQRKARLQIQEPYSRQLPSKARRMFVRNHDFSQEA
jgi:hypothetical protein